MENKAPGVDSVPAEIESIYHVKETLGTGHFSKVKLGVHKETGERVAIKIITKPAANKMSMLKAEVDILTKCDHPNIVKLYHVYETPTTLYLVLELLTGGELFDCIIAKGSYSEADARRLTHTMLDAMLYLHSQGVAHRDLKPENILLKSKDDSNAIKITDFGLSKLFCDNAAGEVIMKTACGTPGYVAPEVLMHEPYSSQVDLWSVGVIVYILLCGFPPFYGDNDAMMFRKIKAGQYKFLSPYWDPISEDAKDFVAKLLVVDPRKRLTAAEALGHKWLKSAERVSTKNLFAGLAGGAPSTPAKAEGELDDEEAAQDDGLRRMFIDFNLDRKVNLPTKLIAKFHLSDETTRVGKFNCYFGNQKGHLHVTSHHVCFLGAFGKKLVVPLAGVTAVAKAKRFKLSPGTGHSLHVSAAGEKHEFNGFVERENCFKTLCAQCLAVNGKLPSIV